MLQAFRGSRAPAWRTARPFASCDRCGASPLPGPEFFWCQGCAAVPPASSAASVDYFEALGFPTQYDVDWSTVGPRFQRLQARFEELARQGAEVPAVEAYVQRCMEAARELREPLSRAEHLLRLRAARAPDRLAEPAPEVRALEDQALSAEVEDSAALARVMERNAEGRRLAEARLVELLQGEQWEGARRCLEEVWQRDRLRRRLEDLAIENCEAATPAHSSTVGGVE
ncbi:unnamed protein product [Prorocentrum cordatum]|uniref:Co-chaperone HscB C-terminal oligomerisation domain-containing protein n=1 Tax=Prorocentrum cordatum TaxID=2364126 RepID=A0ABN9TGP2_9DINO|nr:unnamed protein product [Polarella glacialis]